MATFNFNLQDVVIDHGSNVIGTLNAGDMQQTSEQEILTELKKIRVSLEASEPMIADTLARLEQAICAQDRLKISSIVQQLSVGTAANVLSSLASAGLKMFLGI